MTAPDRPVTLHLDESDNVAVAIEPVRVGQAIRAGALLVVAIDPIPAGHKIALRDIDRDSAVVKYGEPIGKATRDIPAGSHVHVQNTASLRLPGPDTRSPS